VPILFQDVRICGFRGLQNIEISLNQTTVLTGMNNTGKTSFLKAMQIALGNRQFISQDDFFISGGSNSNKILVDLRIIPVDVEGNRLSDFDEDWEILFTEDRIKTDFEGNSFIPLRTIVTFDETLNSYRTRQIILSEWPLFKKEDGSFWYQVEDGQERNFIFDGIPFFYIDAQRDILEDMKLKSSYLGKLISKIEYSQEDIEEIEDQIKALNDKAVSSSSILSNLKRILRELDTAMDTSSEGVEITPFTKKIRDLNKGLSIYYTDHKDSFSMEYHGMGTRSWSSLLTLKAFISLLNKNAGKERTPFFPILAIEEPEAHLHPNAQKKIFEQINSISGQKIISTHSPYIAASAKLEQIRSFYKSNDFILCGNIKTDELDPEDIRKINRQVINTRGEIFFSKAIVFFEGETEEQALPILATYYFKKSPVEMGVDFVGVGGFGNYLPFLRFCKSLNIPWFIFSDGEVGVIDGVKKSLEKLYSRDVNIEDEKNVIILENECDFEKYLIEQGFIDEIENTFKCLQHDTYLNDFIMKLDGTKKFRIKTDKICDACKQSIYKDILRNYKEDAGFKEALYDCMTSQKVQFGPVFAEKMIENGKELPPKVLDLFEQIRQLFDKEGQRDVSKN
jgi:putative ATP-dependent endonuclease of OLD family